MLLYFIADILRARKVLQTLTLQVHMHEIFSLSDIKLLFCIFQSQIDTKRRTTNIFENLIQIRLDIQNFHSLPVFTESQ